MVSGAGWYRSAVSVDPIEARIVRGEWTPPREGDVVGLPGSKGAGAAARWHRVRADSTGWIADEDLADGYASSTIDSDKDRVWILEGFGYQYVYVNGELRAGNLYGYKDTWASWEPRFDFSRLPVRLGAGRNELLFLGSRGDRFKARLVPPPAEQFLNTNDVTLPDLLVGRRADEWAAVVVVNATADWSRGVRLEATVGSRRGTIADVPDLPPLSVKKIPFRLAADAFPETGEAELTLRLRRGDSETLLDQATVPLAIKDPMENQRRTFLSGIDGSVQFYAVNPARDPETYSSPALVFSVHGAGVDALNQSGAYEPKTWAHIVAPTNRRPFGFDWEDWGRLDALEVLGIALRDLDVDPDRVYLTGHSMGGHGVWHLGALYPDRFAAIGPSAGWISFWSYRPSGEVEPRSEVERMVMRCTLPSRTLELAQNYASLGVYVLHGADDDNVPVEQARRMVAKLREFHEDFVYHEEPGAGHWWDKNDEPGTDCVDWPPMFDFFARHARPGAGRVRDVSFRTPNPGVSATDQWVWIEAQLRQLEMSSVALRMDPGRRRFVGTTDNVTRLSLDVSFLSGEGPVTVNLDSVVVETTPRDSWITLYHDGDGWAAGDPAPPRLKGPERYGTFKDAFRHDVVFVIGTQGTPEETAWAYTKARFDAERFWYQANGSIDVVSDQGFDPADYPDRNVVLYGNAESNGAWGALLGASPVQVTRGEVVVGGETLRGDDLGVLMIRPRPDSDVACVAAVSGTGLAGLRLCDRRPYLSAGFAYPDLTVFRASGLRGAAARTGAGSGSSAGSAESSPDGSIQSSSGGAGSGGNAAGGPADCGVLAGFFGLDWSVETGEFAGGDSGPGEN